MKQTKFFNILTRATIACMVAVAPIANVFAEARPSDLRMTFSTSGIPQKEEGKVVQFNAAMPPAFVFSTSYTFIGPQTPSENIRYETITIRTETPEQYFATMDWANEQIHNAQVTKVTYQFFNVVPNTAEGDAQAKFNTENISPSAQSGVTTMYAEPDVAPNWATRVVDYLGVLAFKSASKVSQAATAQNQKLKQRVRQAALFLGRHPKAYKTVLVLGRFIVNGTVICLNMHATNHDWAASILAGGLYMGTVSATLMLLTSKINKWTTTPGKTTHGFENFALRLAQKQRPEALSQYQIDKTIERVGEISQYAKWGTLETTFVGGAHVILHAMKASVLAPGMLGGLEAAWQIILSMSGQANWDKGNGKRKQLVDKIAYSQEDRAKAAEDLIVNNVSENLRSFAISVISVSGVAVSMSNAILGYGWLGVMAVTGFIYNRNINKDIILNKCEERLKAHIKTPDNANVEANKQMMDSEDFDKAG